MYKAKCVLWLVEEWGNDWEKDSERKAGEREREREVLNNVL